MSDELTEAQLAEFKQLLQKAEQATRDGLSSSIADAKPVDLGLSIGRLSRVDALQQQHMAMARRRRVEVQLQQILSALERMKSGTYGACIKCGEPIALARLRARPEALVCLECQSGDGG